MPIALLKLLSKYFSYIRTKNCSTFEPTRFEPTRTPYWIFIIPGLVPIASKHRYLTASHYGCIYILKYNVITQSQGTTILHFIFYMNMRYVSYWVQMLSSPPGTFMFWPVTLSVLFPTCIQVLVQGTTFTSSTATENSLPYAQYQL